MTQATTLRAARLGWAVGKISDGRTIVYLLRRVVPKPTTKGAA